MLRRLRTAYRIYRFSWSDKRTPVSAKALPFVALFYLLWPIDIIPDVLPLLGQADDLTIIIVLCLWAFKMIPEHVKQEIRKNIS